MSDLSNDALAWIAERPGVASDERITEVAAELLALRARVVGGTDGPDQDDPAAWLVTYGQHLVESRAIVDEAKAKRFAAAWGVEAEALVRAPGAVAAASDQDDPAAHDWSCCIDAAPTPDDVPRSPAGYVCQGECRVPGAVAAAPPGDEGPSARFAPGDFVTVADGATVGEYVGYEGGPFHRHRYRLVWPDGTRAPEVSAADDLRVSSADPAVLTGYALARPDQEGNR